MATIKFLVLDVDGTLTDGKIYMGQDGEFAKAFDVKDGAGILQELPKLGILPVIITARESRILANRCEELRIQELYQGVKDKRKKLQEILTKYGETLDSVAYAGDDLPDIPCMHEIKRAGGIVACPGNAIPEIKAIADYISSCDAGNGAVRDIIRYLANKGKGDNITNQINHTMAWIRSNDFSGTPVGKYTREDGTGYSIQEYDTKAEEDCILESHRQHIDVQYMIYGTEILNLYQSNTLAGLKSYNEKEDAEYWTDSQLMNQSLLVPGSICVIKNGVPHKGAIKADRSERVKKLVLKITV